MTSIGLYSIGETIGKGSYGKVKLGTHKLTGKQVAIKEISKEHAPMVAREIHLHRQLKHPNIVMLYEVIITESSIHVISEYCPHGELFDALTERGYCYSERDAVRWFVQLVDALKYCHSQDIVHRDLKLENILLDDNDNAKLCDFGFARHAESRQMLQTFCGSLAYSAPEVILRQKYTGPETDIWSLGVILYTLLAGGLPFDDDSEVVTQRKIVKGDYDIPSHFSPEVSDLITRMLKLNPSERVTIDQIAGHPWI
ncbi:kinase-like domain-containing protein, partial [Zychaea mexicana]|uniref:kinase-like domain-containing protein n=1 Tax=Zychaea mexicana TaxID=64656 RepID=UPI0022FEB4B4